MANFWHEVHGKELEDFRILQHFSSCANDFGHIRKAIERHVAPKAGVQSTTSSVAMESSTSSRHKNGSEPTGCIPFIGLYLSQLHRHKQLPDVIDPTSPHEAVIADSDGNFTGSAHPEVFSSLSPLPPIMQVEPLINVQKQRLIADVIKVLVAGQQLASEVHFKIDRELYLKCMKLQALDDETLKRALAANP